MKKFTEIPTEQFPMNFQTYCRLRDDIYAAAGGFDEFGTSTGRAVSRKLIGVHTSLGDAWELIREIERREKAG